MAVGCRKGAMLILHQIHTREGEQDSCEIFSGAASCGPPRLKITDGYNPYNSDNRCEGVCSNFEWY
jgi:hypothetical protein